MAISVLAADAAMSMFAFTMVHAGISDLTSYKIRNGLMLAFLLSYAALVPFSDFAMYEIGWSAAVAATVLVCAFIFFALGWIGGGDAKLAAVTALWFGADHTPIISSTWPYSAGHSLSPCSSFAACRCRLCCRTDRGSTGCTPTVRAFPMALPWPRPGLWCFRKPGGW